MNERNECLNFSVVILNSLIKKVLTRQLLKNWQNFHSKASRRRQRRRRTSFRCRRRSSRCQTWSTSTTTPTSTSRSPKRRRSVASRTWSSSRRWRWQSLTLIDVSSVMSLFKFRLRRPSSQASFIRVTSSCNDAQVGLNIGESVSIGDPSKSH